MSSTLARKFSVSLKGMLKIETSGVFGNDANAPSAPKTDKAATDAATDADEAADVAADVDAADAADVAKRSWRTLDDVPDFALSTLTQLNSLLLSPFQSFYGVIIHGPLEGTSPKDCYWGRRVKLPSGEAMQLRFSPRSMLLTQQARVFISVKLSPPSGTPGTPHTRNAILFAPDLEIPPAKDNFFALGTKRLAARDLHHLCLSIFKEHDPDLASGRAPRVITPKSCLTDLHGYMSLRATTLSLTNERSIRSTKKQNGAASYASRGFDHQRALSVASGTSLMRAAASLVNVDLQVSAHRAADPIHFKDYHQLIELAADSVCADDAHVGRAAIHAALTIGDILSTEGLLALMANHFFGGGLPSGLESPRGVAMAMAMSIRIAMVPGVVGLAAGTLVDQFANIELRSLFESSVPQLPLVSGKTWALDLVINIAKSEVRETKAFEGLSDSDAAVLWNDQLVFWQRSGQAAITAVFGYGASCDEALSIGDLGVAAWRFEDPILKARDDALLALGQEKLDMAERPKLPVASIGNQRTKMVKLLLDCENYLRTGCFQGTYIAPKSEDTPIAESVLINRNLKPLMAATMFLNNKNTADASSEIKQHLNIPAMATGILQCYQALQAGPSVHHDHGIGAFLVAESQRTVCCRCDAHVHVLQGILLDNAHAHCPKCHAKACLRCASNFSSASVCKYCGV